ncbi:MAG: hypothetical protein PHO75_02570 [Candidatus Shapirobacteria bacterium]|nr:hypothetical protein [Candidatus Shapirobacteria bacterium]
MSERSGSEFINIKYPDLQKSPQVQKSVDKKKRLEDIKTPNNPADRNEVFLNRLENIFDNQNEDTKERNIKLFTERFLYPEVLIDKDNVPDSYFELQIKIAKERGQGGDLRDIKEAKDIPQETRRKIGETLYNDQKQSLDTWIDYLSDKDTSYLSWFKYYVMRNVVKMGNYNKDTHEFNKRTKTSTSIFPDLNREALAYTYDVLQQRYLRGETLEGEELNKVLDIARFDKIYAFAIDKVTSASKENKEKTEGEWTKFNQGDDPTALVESLQGHGTGWCTAGEGVARSQLNGGDFYVYYTKDEKGLNTIPRIAIRMQNGKVAEVRGIEKNQNLEGNMTDIAKEKYQQLPGGEKFDKKDHDMNLLTLIDNKVNNNIDLSENDVIFIYELRDKIEGFGYRIDPRIKEIKSKLDQLKCFNKLTQKEDQEKVAINLVSVIIDEDLSSLSLNKAWKFINEKGGEEAATNLAHRLGDNNLSKKNLDKVWGFINQKGGEAAATNLAHGLVGKYLSEENLDKAWKFINEKGKKKTAAYFVSSACDEIRDIHSKNDTDYYNNAFGDDDHFFTYGKIWEFVFDKGDDNTTASILIKSINVDTFKGNDLERALELIIEKGGEEAAGDLINTIENNKLSGKNLDKAVNFIIKNGYLSKRNISKLWMAIIKNNRDDSFLVKNKKFIEKIKERQKMIN